MGGFASFVTSVNSRVINKHAGTLTDIREATVRQLRELSSRRSLFMEATAEFTLPAREPYNGEWVEGGVGGFPADVMEIDGLSYVLAGGSSTRVPIEGPVALSELRTFYPPFRGGANPLTYTYPMKYAWQGRRLWFNRVTGDPSLTLDYFRDATRDSATGAAITTLSTDKEANPWFDRGYEALFQSVLLSYFTLPTSADQVAAQNAAALRTAALDTIDREWQLKKAGAMQAPMYDIPRSSACL